MREMKNSGVEWIGIIPEQWNCQKLKKFVSINSGEIISKEEYVDAGMFPVIGSNGEIGRTNKCNNSEAVITTGRVGTVGTVHIVHEAWITDNALILKVQGMHLHYLAYVLPCFDFEYMLSGTAQPLITATKLKNQSIPFPTYSEQHRIAAYLDEKCARIDAVIERQRQIIEKLKAYKLSVITEAVTKGLNPDAPMKDSGVEFVGMIPQTWEVMKLGRIIDVQSNLVAPELYPDYPQVSPDSIEKNSARLIEQKTVAESGVISWNHLFHKGQIIYSKIRPLLNKIIIAPFDGLCSADMYPIETAQNKQFVVYMMLSEYFSAQVGLVTENRVKMPKINQNELTNIIIALPPIAEQEIIAEQISTMCERVDDVIKRKQTIIDKLTEYKKSLIYEVVTGKREV